MDFSFLFMFVVAAVAAAALTIRAAVGKTPKNNPLAIAFVASLIVGLLLVRPWAFASTEWRELAAVTLSMAVCVAFGSVAGGALGRRFTKSAK